MRQCPFCEGHFAIGTFRSGARALVHTLPPCAPFCALDAEEFLEAVQTMTREET